MSFHITKAQARSFRERWQRVNALEREETRATNLETRFRQFNTLFNWAHQLGWTNDLEGIALVRQRWAQLRKRCRA